MHEPYKHNSITDHPFYRFLDEIDECLEHRIFMPALGMALMIPDICSKLLYPDSKSVKFSYAAWFDTVAGEQEINPKNRNIWGPERIQYLSYLQDKYRELVVAGGKKKQVTIVDNIVWWPKYSSVDMQCMNGEMLYALRCAFLHNGDTRIDDYNTSYKFRFCDAYMYFNGAYRPIEMIETFSDGTTLFYVNVTKLCKCLIRLGLSYFLEDPKAFDFMCFDFFNATTPIPEHPEAANRVYCFSQFLEDDLDSCPLSYDEVRRLVKDGARLIYVQKEGFEQILKNNDLIVDGLSGGIVLIPSDLADELLNMG